MKRPRSDHRTAITFGIFLAFLLALAISWKPADAQGNCRTPDHSASSTSWPQGVTVTVHINADQFTEDQFNNCIKPAFDNWNNANTSNVSHVTLNASRSSTVLVTATSDLTQVTSAASGYVYQVNKDNGGISSLGVGATGGNGTIANRVNAITNIHTNVTSCEALTQIMAHEIGHTFGSGHLPDVHRSGAVGNDRNKMRSLQ